MPPEMTFVCREQMGCLRLYCSQKDWPVFSRQLDTLRMRPIWRLRYEPNGTNEPEEAIQFLDLFRLGLSGMSLPVKVKEIRVCFCTGVGGRNEIRVRKVPDSPNTSTGF